MIAPEKGTDLFLGHPTKTQLKCDVANLPRPARAVKGKTVR